MSRIIAIDYGTKRTGIAVTDPLQIIANGLTTLATPDLMSFLQKYLLEEDVCTILVGEPKHLDGSPAQIAHLIVGFVRQLKEAFPVVEIVMVDERFTSEDAKRAILQSGASKKKRQDKALIDKVSATIMLQAYLEEMKYKTGT